jgi:hypothetical protein
MAMDAKAMQTGRNEKMCQQVNGHLDVASRTIV